MATAFGQLVVASQVEFAVRDLLRKWFVTYLREVERQTDWQGERLPPPRNYTNRNSFDVIPGEELPKAVVVSPGLWELPNHPESDGYYRATWQIAVGVAIAARTEEEADRQSKMYGAAVRGILVQHQDLENEDLNVVQVQWLDESYDDLVTEDQFMNYKAAMIFVGVDVMETVNRFMRPSEVTEAPENLYEWETVITTIPEYNAVSQVPHA